MQKKYKQRALDAIAQNVLKDYDETLVTGEPREIPILEIIEYHYGLNVEFHHLSKSGDIHGLTIFEDSRIPVYNFKDKSFDFLEFKAGTILIDSRLQAKNRRKKMRFTMAHELAHHILHSEHFLECEEIASKSIIENDSQEEQEADALAASLLLPIGRVKISLKREANVLKPSEKTRSLSNVFGVSQKAMEIRLKQLQLY